MKRVCRVAQLVVALLNRNSHVVATTGTLVYVHYNDTKANRVQVAPINQHEFFMNQQQVLLQPLIALSVSMRAKRTRTRSDYGWRISKKDQVLKVRKYRKQIMVSSILPKNECWDNFQYIKLSQRTFFGRI